MDQLRWRAARGGESLVWPAVRRYHEPQRAARPAKGAVHARRRLAADRRPGPPPRGLCARRARACPTGSRGCRERPGGADLARGCWGESDRGPASHHGPGRVHGAGGLAVDRLDRPGGSIFDRHGLDVQLTYINGGPAGVASLISGELDVLVAGASAVVRSALQGTDTVMIAGTKPQLLGALMGR